MLWLSTPSTPTNSANMAARLACAMKPLWNPTWLALGTSGFTGARLTSATLAAAYAFGLARNHPYLDANKRAALVAMLAFLATNGYDVNADDDDVLTTMIDLAAGRLAEPDLADWLRHRMVPNK